MRRSYTQNHRSSCPISIALDLIGDPWTLLIVRDLMFKGAKTYHDFQHAGEGIATNVLSDRLTRLEANGLLIKKRDPQDARRFIYRLTSKGIALAPMMTELVLWTSAHEITDAPPEVLDFMRTKKKTFLTKVYADWKASQSD